MKVSNWATKMHQNIHVHIYKVKQRILGGLTVHFNCSAYNFDKISENRYFLILKKQMKARWNTKNTHILQTYFSYTLAVTVLPPTSLDVTQARKNKWIYTWSN